MLSLILGPSLTSRQQARFDQIKEKCASFPDRPSDELITKICTLTASEFQTHKQRWQRAFKGVHACQLNEGLEVIVSTKKIHKNQKSPWVAIRILRPLDPTRPVEVEQIFRWTVALNSPLAQLAIDEVELRKKCNKRRNFPELLDSGTYIGKSKKVACLKLMAIERYIPNNLLQYLEKNPEILSNRTLVVKLLHTLLEALTDLHLLENHVHCDMKMQNVMVGNSGLLLTDLGLAIPINERDVRRGSPLLFAPELVENEYKKQFDQTYTPDLDMWGYGMIAYALLHKVLGFPKTPEFTQHQRNFLQNPQISSHFMNWQTTLVQFENSLKSSSDPLAQWLASLLKIDPAERASSSSARIELEKLLEADLTEEEEQTLEYTARIPPTKKQMEEQFAQDKLMNGMIDDFVMVIESDNEEASFQRKNESLSWSYRIAVPIISRLYNQYAALPTWPELHEKYDMASAQVYAGYSDLRNKIYSMQLFKE